MEALRPSTSFSPAPLAAPDLRSFVATVRGRAVTAVDEGYDELRQVHDTSVDRRPAVIVRPAGADDVARAVAFARATGRDLAVRSGGHSLAGHSVADDAVMVDMSALKGLHIDPDRRLAWAQSGLTAGEYGAAVGAHGLATPFGDTSSVGLGGITLGGGIGFLARKHGLAIDNLVSAEVVLADGSIVTASAEEHPDLFWAIRGGGGNFGIVTRFQYRLQPVETVLGGALILPATAEVVRGLLPTALAAPEELTMIAFIMRIPPLPFVPAEAHFGLGVLVMPVYAGDPEAGQRAMDPFRALGTPIADALAPMPYPAIYELTAAGAERHASVTRSAFVDQLDDASVASILRSATGPSSSDFIVQIRAFGGAMGRVPSDATAFAHRERKGMVTFIAMYEGDRAPHEAWAAEGLAGIRSVASGVYSNFLTDEGEARIREAYPGGTYERLVATKRRYDPANVFHLNQNIRP